MDSKQLQDMSRQLDSYTNKFYWYTINIEPKTKAETQIIVYSLAAKSVFGKIRIRIVPCFGAGSFWVDIKKLTQIINPVLSITNNGTVTQIVLDTEQGIFKLSPYLPRFIPANLRYASANSFDVVEYLNQPKG